MAANEERKGLFFEQCRDERDYLCRHALVKMVNNDSRAIIRAHADGTPIEKREGS